jgi:hypothetical protein
MCEIIIFTGGMLVMSVKDLEGLKVTNVEEVIGVYYIVTFEDGTKLKVKKEYLKVFR